MMLAPPRSRGHGAPRSTNAAARGARRGLRDATPMDAGPGLRSGAGVRVWGSGRRRPAFWSGGCACGDLDDDDGLRGEVKRSLFRRGPAAFVRRVVWWCWFGREKPPRVRSGLAPAGGTPGRRGEETGRARRGGEGGRWGVWRSLALCAMEWRHVRERGQEASTSTSTLGNSCQLDGLAAYRGGAAGWSLVSPRRERVELLVLRWGSVGLRLRSVSDRRAGMGP
ncbi:hypothetical protein BJ875DRAFT_288810 [Amylocarpus encephaloides]|uniref:Uncharacterized protein n=1 Tax=Amylocarpus encephaloides TaxID=45428 RepID=A0A9P7YKY7_9HELO|nr:hypothetical protein BJ875DRAFT_288810 [Amylocarpus encephaloides]